MHEPDKKIKCKRQKFVLSRLKRMLKKHDAEALSKDCFLNVLSLRANAVSETLSLLLPFPIQSPLLKGMASAAGAALQ